MAAFSKLGFFAIEIFFFFKCSFFFFFFRFFFFKKKNVFICFFLDIFLCCFFVCFFALLFGLYLKQMPVGLLIKMLFCFALSKGLSEHPLPRHMPLLGFL